MLHAQRLSEGGVRVVHQVGKTYTFSKISLKMTNSKYNSTKCPYEMSVAGDSVSTSVWVGGGGGGETDRQTDRQTDRRRVVV